LSDAADFLSEYAETLRYGLLDADLPPELTAQFSIDALIKQSEGRSVYFVTRKSDGERAVLRVTEPDSNEDIALEYSILNRLDHPAIPKALAVYDYNYRSYLVREFFEGDDLAAYVRKHGALSREKLVEFTIRLCDILTYIHNQDPPVIHRDIKPENIIMLGRDNIGLIDFGIARDYRPSDGFDFDTHVAGTRPYMPLEQFGGQQTDARADIYALGVVMLFMATGQEDKQNLRKLFPYKELVRIVEKCIQPDRARRFRSAAKLKAKIIRSRRRITRKVLSAIGVCAIAAAALLTGFHFGRRNGSKTGYLAGSGIGRTLGYGQGLRNGISQGYEKGSEDGYSEGFAEGREQGFTEGVDSIMDIPPDIVHEFTEEELWQPVTFENWYLDVAVRGALSIGVDDVIYLDHLVKQISKINIYGTYVPHPSSNVYLIKNHLGKGTVKYLTNDGLWWHIERGNLNTLVDIPKMFYLHSLILTSESFSDLSPLTGMMLTELVIADNYVGNLLPLKDMGTLITLDICQNPVANLTPISRLYALETLDISQTEVTDLAPLSDLVKLKNLSLVYCDVSDLSPLSGLKNLSEVDLRYSKVTDLTPIARPESPVTVHCEGLPENVIERAKNTAGLVVIEKEPSLE